MINKMRGIEAETCTKVLFSMLKGRGYNKTKLGKLLNVDRRTVSRMLKGDLSWEEMTILCKEVGIHIIFVPCGETIIVK